MGYDITNNSSVIQLAPAEEFVEVGNIKAIEIPLSIPFPELIQEDNVLSNNNSIELPLIVPSPQLLPVESIVQEQEVIVIPTQVPNDPLVLLENIPLPSAGKTVIGDKYYVHLQSTPLSLWEIYHNLGKRPSIHIEDINGNVIITQIIHIDNNHAQAHFGRNYSGSAHCN